MNKSALKAAFNSLSFRARFHGAMMGAVKKKYSHYVKNRAGQPFMRVTWDSFSGFTFTDKQGVIIDRATIYSFLRS